MSLKKYALLSAIAALVAPVAAHAAVVLGDIAIVRINATDPDSFSFVALSNIAAGDTINFTDNGWFAAGGFRNNEGAVTYTAPAGGVSAGTIINWQGESTGVWSALSSFSTFTFSTSGDSLTAFTGTIANPTPLYIVSTNGSNFNADATTANTTARPSTLASGTNAVSIGTGTSTTVTNGTYDTTKGTKGTKAQLQALIANSANWLTTTSSTRYTTSIPSFTVVPDPNRQTISITNNGGVNDSYSPGFATIASSATGFTVAGLLAADAADTLRYVIAYSGTGNLAASNFAGTVTLTNYTTYSSLASAEGWVTYDTGAGSLGTLAAGTKYAVVVSTTPLDFLDNSRPAGLTFLRVGAIPEPSTMVGLLAPAALLMGRRRREAF